MAKLLIVADDFTGGLDTGVHFASRGITTRVVTDPSGDLDTMAEGCQVLVVVSDTRHMTPGHAYLTVYDIVSRGKRSGIPCIYKKTDSALRGNIGAELSAALRASGETALPFLPALPQAGRITVDGVHLIDGVPVAESVFGRDPFEPVTVSDVCGIIALQSDVKTQSVKPDALPEAEGILVIDAQSDGDIDQAGRALYESGRLRVCAGCAGFAAVLPDLLGLSVTNDAPAPGLDGGLLVLCGSVNPITQAQLTVAESSGFKRIHITPEQKLDPGCFDTKAGKAVMEDFREAVLTEPFLILDANDPDNSNTETRDYADRHHLTTDMVRRGISDALGRILKALIALPARHTMLITGGDTLLACMRALSVSRMEPIAEVFPGVVMAKFEFDGVERRVITKSGGFGKETLLRDLKDICTA